ncbi:MAG: hypothetical protein FJX75_15410 [Armatimonadetes bacterium]|nr:hypothetical protein [Armatimonadota bacterium]
MMGVLVLVVGCASVTFAAEGVTDPVSLKLLPYPQELSLGKGVVRLGPPSLQTDGEPSPTEQVAAESARQYLPQTGRGMPLRLGSMEEGYRESWLSKADREFLQSAKSEEAYVLTAKPGAITIVGRSRWAMLEGVQTLNQLALSQGDTIPAVRVRDWPELRWRCLSPTLTWYSGWNRLEGYDLCNWTLDEWKWLVDWSLLHKLNAWAICMYGYWPFSVPGYEESTLDVDSFAFDPVTGLKTPRRFTHRNIRREFLPELIRSANERGIQVYAYIGKNSFNGGYILHHPEANAGGAAEASPFAPGVREYWDAFVGRIVKSGFNGFVFEDPEAYHVPNQTDECYQTFWAPWADTYGFHSREETDANKPPLGVHVEYYTWLFREFDGLIRRHTERLGRSAEIFLISHILLSRIVGESKTPEEIDKWFDLVDQKQGRNVRFIVNEFDEDRYTALLGGDRVASLGGRGGSCLSAWRRMTGVNNNATPGPMGASVDWERDAQRRIQRAGGFGAMGYVFEWRSCEIYGYLAAQHLWRSRGVPGIDNQDQIGFLDYAYRAHYGDEVGALVARALDTSPCVNDAMVLEEVHGAQYPETGRALHRDYQFLAAQADEALALAEEAYKHWTGTAPDLDQPAYDPETFRWAGFDRQADHAFKAESLRWLCVELRRAQLLCEAALAHRLAARRVAEGAGAQVALPLLDHAIECADENRRLYQVNFDDDYHANEGLCVTLADRLRELRAAFEAGRNELGPALLIPWEKLTDLVPERPAGSQPGLRLVFDIGLNALRDVYCHGVAFTIETEGERGEWQPVFRRALGKNSREWEHWEVPLAPNPEPLRLRFVTDSYSRAQPRDALSWEWALWGDPRLVQVAQDGRRTDVYRFADRLADARAFVRLDANGRERPFDGAGRDSTGASFALLEPSPLAKLRAGEGKAWQWVQGFAERAPGYLIHHSPYRHYLGVAPSTWGYARDHAEIAWLTAPVPKAKTTAVAFIGGTDYTPGHAELRLDGRRLLVFNTGSAADAAWREGAVELRYLHGAEVHDERITYGLSGAFVLVLPASLITPGRPLALSVRMLDEGQSWFMIHEYADSLAAADRVLPPAPCPRVITAFTPHLSGAYGVTGAEFIAGVWAGH